VKNFEKCVEDDLKKEILLPKVEEFTEARREKLIGRMGEMFGQVQKLILKL